MIYCPTVAIVKFLIICTAKVLVTKYEEVHVKILGTCIHLNMLGLVGKFVQFQFFL